MVTTRREPEFVTPHRQRAVGYGRVSTKRQAEHQISLDEQQRKIEACAEALATDLSRMFIEPGVTGRLDQRPQFQEMLKFVCDPENQIDFVIVYSFSRIFRNATQHLFYRDQLRQHGVRLISATQAIPKGPDGDLLETVIAAVDAHQSDTNAATVRDMMMANAEAGFWNGSKPPYGYKARTALVLRRKEKKVLEIDEAEAAVVNTIFRLYLEGSGQGPMGIKAIAKHMNEKGYRQRGKAFYTASIERILKNEAYIGTHYYNRIDSRTRKQRPPSEWIKMSVPQIVEAEVFDAVQSTLKARNPRTTPPRVVTGPTLLTGIAVCSNCGRGMMLRTGKGGQYKYLTCAKDALEGTGCGQSIRMDKIDELVLHAVESEVFAAERLSAILEAMIDRSDAGRQQLEVEISRQGSAVAQAKTRLERLYDAIESGVADLGDPGFKDRVDLAKLQVRAGTAALESLRRRRQASVDVSPEMLRRFSAGIRRRLRDADPAFRRAWLHMFVSEVIVSKQAIRIRGPKDTLLKAISTNDDFVRPIVPSFARDWRTRRDSNSRPLPSEGSALSS